MIRSLQDIADQAVTQGPDRVIIAGDGSSLPPAAARAKGAVPHIILIRDDGWTLGAPEHLAKTAEALWSAEWIGYVKRPSRVAHPLNVSAGSRPPAAGTPPPSVPSAESS